MLSTPYYIIDEERLRRNLSLTRRVASETGADFILAFKAFALWKTFPIFREYIRETTASSPYEARLALDAFGARAHTFSPAYEEATFGELLRCSSHLTFNSLSQYERFYPQVRAWNAAHSPVSCGLRINPAYSEIETELYNPCAPGSRFGVTADLLSGGLPEGIDGLHCHNHCESSAAALSRSLAKTEAAFGHLFPRLKWLNLGGGHLLTREDYDVPLLKELLVGLRSRYPQLRILLEPGSAFAWETGELVAQVVDVVSNQQIKTAILNVSFTCHMPDCLEMPYKPQVRGAQLIPEAQEETCKCRPDVYRLGGNSCLSGDFLGYWAFPKGLLVGDVVVFEDMMHYTTVKTTMFNGLHHPSIVLRRRDGSREILRAYAYEDYRDRMC